MTEKVIVKFREFWKNRKRVWRSTYFRISFSLYVIGTILIYKLFFYWSDFIEQKYGGIGLFFMLILFVTVSIFWEKFSDLVPGFIVNSNKSIEIPKSLFMLEFSDFLFGKKVRKKVFEPIIADWQEEYFEALFKKEIWKARWINVRYTYAFVCAMWMKSPLGDLLEFIRKIAK